MSVARNVGLATVGNLIVPIASLVTQPLLAHGLGVDGRGELAAATVPLILVVASFTLGLPEALTQYVAQRSMTWPLFARTIGILVLAGIVGTVAIWQLARALSAGNAHVAALMIIAAAFAAPALATAGLRGWAAGVGGWGLVAGSRVLGALFQLVGTLVLVLIGRLDTMSATLVVALGTFVGGLVFLRPRLLRRSLVVSVGQGELLRLGEVMSFGSRMWFGAVAGILLMRIDQVLIAPLSGIAQLGLYAVAASVSEVILVANAGIRDVVFALESRERNLGRVAYATRVSTCAVTCLAIVVAIASPVLLPLLFGPGFEDALPALFVLLGGVVLGNPGSIPGMALAGWGRPELRSYALTAALVVNLLAVALLVPSLGAVGAALATLVSSFVAGWLNIYWLKRLYGMRVIQLLIMRPHDYVRAWSHARRSLARWERS